MNEDELDKLLEEDRALAKEKKEWEELLAIERERENRMVDALNEWKRTHPGTFQDETGKYPELDERVFPPPPPASYWRWFAERMIRFVEQIEEHGWNDDFERIDTNERMGRIAIGLLHFARKRNVESLAEKLEQVIYFGTDGRRVKDWLMVEIGRRLLSPSPEIVENDQDIEDNGADVKPANEPPAQNGLTWQEVSERLLVIAASGQKFISERKLAKQICCAPNTVGRAIKETPRLQIWAGKKTAKGKTFALSDQDLNACRQTREVNPFELAELRDEFDVLLAKLVEEVEPDERARHLEKAGRIYEDPEAMRLWIENYKNEHDECSISGRPQEDF